MTSARGREIPLTIIDTRKPVAEEAAAHHHDAAGEGPRSLGRAPPCFLRIGAWGREQCQRGERRQGSSCGHRASGRPL